MSVVLVVSVCLALSMSTFVGCSDNDEADKTLISGDFTKEATSEQLSELSKKISSSNSATLYGDSSEKGWSYNVRIVEIGEVHTEISSSSSFQLGGSLYKMNAAGKTDANVNADHTISFYNDGEEIDVWGSGTVEVSNSTNTSTVMQTSGGVESGSNSLAIKYSGDSYNDAEYMYVDGSIYFAYDSSIGTGNSTSESAKVKMVLSEALYSGIDIEIDDIAEALIDLEVIRSAMNTDGVTVYVDESSEGSQKIKISYSKVAWVNEVFEGFLDELSAGEEVFEFTYDELYNNTEFKYLDYYLEFDNDTGILVGAGMKMDVSMNVSYSEEAESASVLLGYDYECWYMGTDTSAGELPSDLDEYELWELGV